MLFQSDMGPHKTRALQILSWKSDGKIPLEMLKDREPLPGEYMDRDLRVKKLMNKDSKAYGSSQH